jgi:hypothetical protein
VLKTLLDRSGKGSIVRAGGSTANRVAYNASQEEQVINVFGSNPDQPSHVYIGPSWYEAFETSPQGVQFIYDLNYRDNSSAGVNNTIADASRVWANLRDVLYAFELGNEMEGWGESTGRPADWDPELYTEDYLNYTALIDDQVFGDQQAGEVEPIFQGGTFQGSGGPWINEPWNSVNVMADGINRDGQIRSMSQHDYHGSNCGDGDPVPELRANLLNHTNVVERVYPHWVMSPIVSGYGVDYVLGETNSISCQGRENVSDVFGAALWYLDYTLYVAANTSVARMYFHQGTMYRYSLWAPFENATTTSALIRPSYYGALLLADAIGSNSGEKQVAPVKEEGETFVAYSLYDQGVLDSVIVVNMDPYNVTANYSRPSIDVDVDAPNSGKGEVFRLTAPGSDVKDGVVYAGQTVSEEGLVVGEPQSEAFIPGQPVKLHSSEAVLIKFGSRQDV